MHDSVRIINFLGQVQTSMQPRLLTTLFEHNYALVKRVVKYERWYPRKSD